MWSEWPLALYCCIMWRKQADASDVLTALLKPKWYGRRLPVAACLSSIIRIITFMDVCRSASPLWFSGALSALSGFGIITMTAWRHAAGGTWSFHTARLGPPSQVGLAAERP